MENNGFIGVPIGGIIPWIGARYGIPLPDNYTVLDGYLPSVPSESPFHGFVGDFPDMEGYTYHCVNGSNDLFNTQGSDSLDITIEKENIPTTYTYTEVIPDYTEVNNSSLNTVTSEYRPTSKRPFDSGYYPSGSLSTDGSDGEGGGGNRLPYIAQYGSNGRSKLSHTHTTTKRHFHIATGNGGTSTKSGYVDFGAIGSGTSITLPTDNDNMSRASCLFIMRIW